MARRGTLLAFIRARASVDEPMVPGSWGVVGESARWSTLYPLGRVARPDVFCHARLVLRDSGTPTRAMFVIVGPPAVLTAIAAMVVDDALPWTRTWADLPAFRADAGAVAVAIRAAWPDERPNGVGALVALWARMAGWNDDDAEGGPS